MMKTLMSEIVVHLKRFLREKIYVTVLNHRKLVEKLLNMHIKIEKNILFFWPQKLKAVKSHFIYTQQYFCHFYLGIQVYIVLTLRSKFL